MHVYKLYQNQLYKKRKNDKRKGCGRFGLGEDRNLFEIIQYCFDF